MVDMKKFGEELVDLVKAFVSARMDAFAKRIDALSLRIDEMPVYEIDAAAHKAVAEVMAKVEMPKDGKDADPEEVKALVLAAVAEIPLPKDGVSVTVDDVAPLIAEHVEQAVKALPPPTDGKNVDPQVVAEMVRAEVAKIPPAEPGKSVTLEDVQPLIAELVERTVEAIEKPKDGKDADPVDHEAIVKSVLALVRTPEDGKSVTPADVGPMLSDLVSKAVAGLPKPKDGESVPIDQVQKMIDEAVTKAIAAVQMPKDGERGLDALDIDVLPAINEARRYARGTYASHKGGLWVSRRSTEGMDGWECIVNGVCDIEYTPNEDDPRVWGVKTLLADGKSHSMAVYVPSVIYKGVFREGDEYSPGDTVTWGGSLWHCNEATKDKPLDGSKSWTLCAKKGRDGKDGRNGIDAIKPVKLS